MEMMDMLKLLGILIVIIGFALKLDSILIIVVAAVVLYLLFCFNWKEYYGWNLSDLMFWKHKKG